MGIKDKAKAFSKKFKLDSHHAIERFGIFFSVFVVTGLVVVAAAAASAAKAGSESLASTALYNHQFETSKTKLKGEIDGVYVNESRTRALAVMHFPATAAISYSAADYQAFLLGIDERNQMTKVSTPGIEGHFVAFGSTGYVGVLLEADEPFTQQILNLTIRANKELSFNERQQDTGSTTAASDASFSKYDQWRIIMNPGATGAQHLKSLDAKNFDIAHAYYEVAVAPQEKETRDKLDSKLLEMRSNLQQITSYTKELETTKVDGLFLRPPEVPPAVAGDEIVGSSASETSDGVSSLELKTSNVVPGGFEVNWRSGDVYSGYLDALVPRGENYVNYLSSVQKQESDGVTQQISDMKWVLSNGSDLKHDYQSSDVTMRPLINVMNNLSQAYTNYAKNKTNYQSDLMFELLSYDVQLRDVQANGSTNSDGFLITNY